MNHRSLKHPNIVRFKEVYALLLTVGKNLLLSLFCNALIPMEILIIAVIQAFKELSLSY